MTRCARRHAVHLSWRMSGTERATTMDKHWGADSRRHQLELPSHPHQLAASAARLPNRPCSSTLPHHKGHPIQFPFPKHSLDLPCLPRYITPAPSCRLERAARIGHCAARALHLVEQGRRAGTPSDALGFVRNQEEGESVLSVRRPHPPIPASSITALVSSTMILRYMYDAEVSRITTNALARHSSGPFVGPGSLLSESEVNCCKFGTARGTASLPVLCALTDRRPPQFLSPFNF